ncbi:MAG: hypothetical protein JW829_17175 [Pirellulales bacterium]|nr:hypothetical protein [Pirellulales bacterium]
MKLFHGPCVEINDRWAVEAVWAGDFGNGDFDQTDLVFGTGIRMRENRIVFVSSGTTLDRLCYCWHDNSWYVSNSLPALLAGANLSLRDDYHQYAEDISTIFFGLNEYKRLIPTTTDDVRLVYFNNLTYHNGCLTETAKIDTADRFETFEDYALFLAATAGQLANNMNDKRRRQQIYPLTTVSSGYDTAAAAVIAQRTGCRSAVTFMQSNSLWKGSDSGQHIAEQLGLSCKTYNRTSERYPLEESIWAAAGRPGVLNWTLFDYPEPLCLFFTGCYGDEMWDRRQWNLPYPFTGCTLANGGIGEFRLLKGVFHCPVPFWGVRRRSELHKINYSKQMEPWTLHNKYDRPIPRRILEEVGIPRHAFGQRKRLTSHEAAFLWPYSADSQARFCQFLKRRGLRVPSAMSIWLMRRWAWFENLAYKNIGRRLHLPDWGIRHYLAARARQLIFQWANGELREQYQSGFESNPSNCQNWAHSI